MEVDTKLKHRIIPLAILFCFFISGLFAVGHKVQAEEGATVDNPSIYGQWNGILQGADTFILAPGNGYTVPQTAYNPYPYDMEEVNLGMDYVSIGQFRDYLELGFDTPSPLSYFLNRTSIFKLYNYDFWCTIKDLDNTYFELDENPQLTNSAYITIHAVYLGTDYEYHTLDYSITYGEGWSNPLFIDNLGDLFSNALYPLKTFGEYQLVHFAEFTLQVDWIVYNTVNVDNIGFYIFFDRVNDLSYQDYLNLSSTYSQSLVAPSNVDIVGTLATNVNSFLQIEILPNFSFMTLLICAVTIPLTLWLLKSYFGG